MTIDKIKRDLAGVYYPCSNEELQCLIQYAKENHFEVRTVGSGHSPAPAVFEEKILVKQIKINLDGDFRKISSIAVNDDKETAIVKVGAGCNLGINPKDPRSSLENSFNFQVDKMGYALPMLGGISHQTIAGFMQTSSSGGTTKHGISDVLEEIELIDGNGKLRCFKKGYKEFDAAAVSMGLFGVITSATFKLPKKYNVQGLEQNREFKDSLLAQDEKGQRTALKDAITNNEYLHINWLAQSNVNRTMQWAGKQVSADTPTKPYTHTLHSKLMTFLAQAVLEIGTFIDTFTPTVAILEGFKGALLRLFADPSQKQEFCDTWYKALPIDDQADVDSSMNLFFSEIWFPVDQIDLVMKTLDDTIKKDPRAAGNFIIEMYGAKESPFLLSPGYGRNSFRVDLYWWYKNIGTPEEYFGIFWRTLLDIPGARLHWGKHLPIPGVKYGDKTFTAENLYRDRYPKFAEWLQIREQMDPQQLFVSSYWRNILNIPKPGLNLNASSTNKVVDQKSESRDEKSTPSTGFVSGWLEYFGLYRTSKPDSKPATEPKPQTTQLKPGN